nr:hypothetical protein [Methylomarinum sp. Ch1-1]MDP4523245.1 hypothetical protein [Methylomarinum sp. Ch1-1]
MQNYPSGLEWEELVSHYNRTYPNLPPLNKESVPKDILSSQAVYSSGLSQYKHIKFSPFGPLEVIPLMEQIQEYCEYNSITEISLHKCWEALKDRLSKLDFYQFRYLLNCFGLRYGLLCRRDDGATFLQYQHEAAFAAFFKRAAPSRSSKQMFAYTGITEQCILTALQKQETAINYKSLTDLTGLSIAEAKQGVKKLITEGQVIFNYGQNGFMLSEKLFADIDISLAEEQIQQLFSATHKQLHVSGVKWELDSFFNISRHLSFYKSLMTYLANINHWHIQGDFLSSRPITEDLSTPKSNMILDVAGFEELTLEQHMLMIHSQVFSDHFTQLKQLPVSRFQRISLSAMRFKQLKKLMDYLTQGFKLFRHTLHGHQRAIFDNYWFYENDAARNTTSAERLDKIAARYLVSTATIKVIEKEFNALFLTFLDIDWNSITMLLQKDLTKTAKQFQLLPDHLIFNHLLALTGLSAQQKHRLNSLLALDSAKPLKAAKKVTGKTSKKASQLEASSEMPTKDSDMAPPEKATAKKKKTAAKPKKRGRPLREEDANSPEALFALIEDDLKSSATLEDSILILLEKASKALNVNDVYLVLQNQGDRQECFDALNRLVDINKITVNKQYLYSLKS